MNKEEKNTSSIILFIIVIIIIGIGGYYFVTNHQASKKESSEFVNQNNSLESIKIDEAKDYIYFTNEDKISDENDLTYKDIAINIKTDDAKNLAQKLNDKMSTARNSLKKISTSDDKDLSSSDDVYSTDMIEYNVIETSKYLSLNVSNFTYDVKNGRSDSLMEYYVFDLSTGLILSNHDIMNKENITDQDIRSKIRSYIASDNGVDVDTTLNNPYYLTIAKNGNVLVNLVVKSDSFNYNISIEMD